MGSAHPLNAPYQAFETADGWINIGAANQNNWRRLVEAIGHEELAEDDRFLENADRVVNREALELALNDICRTRVTADWLNRLTEAGVPAGPVHTIAEMHANPQTLAREMVVETDHAALGPVKSLGLPVKFSRTPGAVDRPAPLLGEHARQILREYGYDSDEIESLISSGSVMADGARPAGR